MKLIFLLIFLFNQTKNIFINIENNHGKIKINHHFDIYLEKKFKNIIFSLNLSKNFLKNSGIGLFYKIKNKNFYLIFKKESLTFGCEIIIYKTKNKFLISLDFIIDFLKNSEPNMKNDLTLPSIKELDSMEDLMFYRKTKSLEERFKELKVIKTSHSITRVSFNKKSKSYYEVITNRELYVQSDLKSKKETRFFIRIIEKNDNFTVKIEKTQQNYEIDALSDINNVFLIIRIFIIFVNQDFNLLTALLTEHFTKKINDLSYYKSPLSESIKKEIEKIAC